jgi:hypothetical protein
LLNFYIALHDELREARLNSIGQFAAIKLTIFLIVWQVLPTLSTVEAPDV